MSKKIVAVACSTGGPKALQKVIPKLPKYLGAPVVLVQHMPEGFTKSLADRLDETSEICVKEAVDNEIVKSDCVYVAKAGKHLQVYFDGLCHRIALTDEDYREGVKPCANFMYESLCNCKYDEIICVVLTGMGSDGSAGIINLSHKKKINVLIQDRDSCVVYGMPGSIAKNGIPHKVVKLNEMADEIKKMVEG